VVFSVVGNAPDLDDVVQRVWFRIWQDASQLSDSTRWRPWMYRIARNAAIDALRSDRRRRDRLQQVAEQQQVLSTSVAEAPETLLSANEDAQAMMDAIESLPELYRAPFVLKHVEGWSYQQIAETLDIARDTVETRLVRARRRLKKQLSGVVAGS
jgi:RNA polymerase sigma-70 factor (ECF subfamily)